MPGWPSPAEARFRLFHVSTMRRRSSLLLMRSLVKKAPCCTPALFLSVMSHLSFPVSVSPAAPSCAPPVLLRHSQNDLGKALIPRPRAPAPFRARAGMAFSNSRRSQPGRGGSSACVPRQPLNVLSHGQAPRASPPPARVMKVVPETMPSPHADPVPPAPPPASACITFPGQPPAPVVAVRLNTAAPVNRSTSFQVQAHGGLADAQLPRYRRQLATLDVCRRLPPSRSCASAYPPA